jgi:hypothetical protein
MTTAPDDPPSGKVIVMTVWTHYPEMMKLQVKSLRAFLHEPFEYLAVLNSASNENADLAVMADHLGVFSKQMKPHEIVLGASSSHGFALNSGMAYLLNKTSPIQLRAGDILFLLDSDMFLTSPTNLRNELEQHNHQILSMPQQRGPGLTYLWPNFCILNLSRLEYYQELNFLPGVATVEGKSYSMDSGGQTLSLLARHPEWNISWVRGLVDCVPSKDELCQFFHTQRDNIPRTEQCAKPELLEYAEREHHCEIDSNSSTCLNHARFYHLGSAGSNWRGCPEQYLADRRRDLENFIERLIAKRQAAAGS